MRSSPAVLSALRSSAGMRRVLAAYALFGFIEFFVWLTVILWAFDVSGAYLAGAAAVAQLLPAALVAPALASVGDRMPRGTALALAHAAVAVTSLGVMAALWAGSSPWVVITAGAVLTTALATTRPLHFAALPPLAVTPDALVSANSLSSFSDGTFRFLGPVAAGVSVTLLGYWQAFAMSAALAAIAALLCRGLGLARPREPAGRQDGPLRAAVVGLLSLRGDVGSLALLVVLTVDFVLTGALDVLGVAYAGAASGAQASGAGLLIGSMGVGGLLGAIVGAPAARRRRLAPVVVACGVAEGLTFAAVAIRDSVALAVVLLVASGASGIAMLVAGRTLLHRATDDRLLARVFAVQESTSMLGTAVGAILAPMLLEALSPAGAFVPLGLGCALMAVGGTVLVRRLDTRSVNRAEQTSLLRGVPFLGVLPEYDLTRLAANATWEVVEAGRDVVRQGEEGRRFYVVAEGEFGVTVDGVRRPVRLGPGSGFGEIALLRAVPRTATVTASTAGLLLAVEAEDFLAAVTGHADGRLLAEEVASHHLVTDEGSPR